MHVSTYGYFTLPTHLQNNITIFGQTATLFQIRHISTHRIYSFQVQNAVTKVEWTQRIKNLLVESLPQLPEKV